MFSEFLCRGFHGSQALLNFPFAHLAQNGDLDDLILAGFGCAGFPVVYGLRRDAED